MNDIKLSNVSLPAAAKPAETGKTAASAPPSKSDAQPDSVKNQNTVINAQEIAAAKAEEASKQQEVQKTELNEAVTKLNDYIQSVQRNLEFNVDDESGKTVVKVVDRNTQEVVRQIPDEQALKMAQNLQQEEPLSLFTMKV